ncbi:polymeric immunoglobulin receptor-like [Hemibagrus wyckioides]|uniref:polymeric immunoglobulin receptor-like n=1 Tax=Hemibagrus wyckioides TaxID=337641 RepID=UPI00266B6559|nr:polymeric immunoglobulin receptor-like [Hemibagrus wyckioides]
MKILLIFTLCLISDGGASKEVTGYSGGGVLIKCKYDTEYRQNTKFFCKGSWPVCSDPIKTDIKNKWVNSERFSLFDDTKSSLFWVMIRELTVQDSGTYQCVVDKRSAIYTPVGLKVKEDLSYKKFISERVHVGGNLTVSCKYPESLRSDPKFLCRMRLLNLSCSYKDEIRINVTNEKFSLYDDRAKQTFNVTIKNVTEQDSGEYWCGTEAAWTSDHGYKVYFTRINLTVIQMKPEFPSSIVITVSVGLLVRLLVGVLVLLVFFGKIQGGKASIDKCSVHSSGNNQEYEEVKDTRRLSASDAMIFTVYASAQLPTIPSEPSHTVYSNKKFPTSSCDSTVYSTTQLPTIPPDQDVYSTAQFPTDLSDTPDSAAQQSAEETAEDL